MRPFTSCVLRSHLHVHSTYLMQCVRVCTYVPRTATVCTAQGCPNADRFGTMLGKGLISQRVSICLVKQRALLLKAGGSSLLRKFAGKHLY